MACSRVGYAYTCQQCWPRNPARWCDSCFERFGPNQVEDFLNQDKALCAQALANNPELVLRAAELIQNAGKTDGPVRSDD